MKLGISQKVWFTIIGISFLIILLTITITIFLYEKLYVDNQINSLLLQGKQLESVYSTYGNSEEFQDRIKWLNESSESAIIFTDDPMQLSAGVPIHDFLDNTLITFAERQQLLAGEIVVMVRQHDLFDQQILAIAIPLLENDYLEGAIFLYMPLTEVYEPFESILLYISFTILFIILIVIWSGRKISRSIIDPIKQMEAISKYMAQGDFSQKININRKDEIGSLAKSFNLLATSLQEVEKERRQFLQDISHELRTPLSYLKGYAEAIVDGMAHKKEDIYRYVGIMRHEIDRLQRLVNDLLDLTQLEGYSYSMKAEPIPFAQLVRDAVQKYELIVQKKGINIKFELDDEIIIKGDADRLEQVVRNILDNAIRVTNTGDKITFTMSKTKTVAKLMIEDTGPGISKEDLNKITERFYRVNKARTRKDGGTGLGLAIVKQIIAKHNGKFRIHSTEGKGTIVEVQLPLFEL